ncbi:32200_t:CDS:2, partial [Gigaspora margarita]
ITYINLAFFSEKRNLEARYTKRQRQSKESQLIKLAKDKIGEAKKIEEDHQTFMLTMIMETKKLEEHVVQLFNQAIKDGTSKISDENKPREKFNQRSSSAQKSKDVLEYTTGYQTFEKNKLNNTVGNVIKTKIKKPANK